MSFNWTVTPEAAWVPLYAQRAEQIEVEIVALANQLTDDITDYMKQNAPWTDRTGDARANLYSVVQHAARQTVTILLSHGSLIPYGVYLEVLHAGRFAIIAPSVDVWGPQMLQGVRAILRRHLS